MHAVSAIGYGLILSIAASQASAATAIPDDADQARQLLTRAAEYYRTQGDAAFAAFSRQGEFIDGEHYVFVVDTKGTMLASGGNSAVLIGRDVSRVLHPELQRAFANASNMPEGTIGTADYRWMNAREGRAELKHVFYQRLGDRILAVDHSLPRASEKQADSLLEHAVAALQRDPTATLAAINDLSADYRLDDLYVFVIDRVSHRYLAHGYNSRLLGVDFTTIKDADGKPIGKPIVDMMSTRDRATYAYRWKSPVTSKVEDKHALIRKTHDYLVVVGYYQKPR